MSIMERQAVLAPDWLVRRPIAHRGLHDRASGIIENSGSAARCAMAAGYGIECDVQRTADGEALVFHDDRLDRLTGLEGPVALMPSESLTQVVLSDSDDRIASLPRFLSLVGGEVPLICEIKSQFDGDMRLAERVADLAATYEGPMALKSFDPAVIAHLRKRGCARPLGIVSEARFKDADSALISKSLRETLINFLHFSDTRPDFISYCVDDLPHAAPFLCRTALGLPLIAWTVRSEAQRRHAARWADQIVFEGFAP